MNLDHGLIELIDEHRRRGESYDALHSKLRGAVGDGQIAHVLNAYGATRLADGRRRDQVNLGDPEERHG